MAMKLLDLVNKMGRVGKYQEPTEENISQAKVFVDLLIEYDNFKKEPDNFKTMLNSLDLVEVTVKEIPSARCYFSESRDQWTNQIFILWNFKKCFNFIISYQHSGTDNVDELATIYFKTGYKAVIANGLQPRAANKGSELQPKRNAADGCHSLQVVSPHLVGLLCNKYKYGLVSHHGMTSNKDFKIWFLNSLGNIGFNTKNKNFPLLLTIAYFLSGIRDKAVVNDEFKDFYLERNGEIIYMTQKIITKRGPTSDVPMRLVNKGRDSGRAVHIEHAITYFRNQKNISELMSVHVTAQRWFELWDDTFHSFKNIPKNLNMFEEYINSKIIHKN